MNDIKDRLAKLLATENITVRHSASASTASFDVKNRVLRLPIWKEMSGSLYDLMVLHEVGHALYTPEDGWHGAGSNKGAGYKSFLNVVEDARIVLLRRWNINYAEKSLIVASVKIDYLKQK